MQSTKNHQFQQDQQTLIHFPFDIASVRKRIDQIDPVRYGSNRNFINGSVSYLSPYISRGFISLNEILAQLKNRGFKSSSIEKFLQELAWREFWQKTWNKLGEKIDHDLKFKQDVEHFGIAQNIVEANTGILAIDKAILEFYQTGYLHNHLRMYIASLACNFGNAHWLLPAKWMYYHLLDADWGSNALSWQWVAGTNSHKKYYFNQENLNKYTFSNQKGTFLDHSYSTITQKQDHETLRKITKPKLECILPTTDIPQIDPDRPCLIYNFYNIDPSWHPELKANRILLFEPTHFERYPVSSKSLEFAIELSKSIPGIQVISMDFEQLYPKIQNQKIYYKEHVFTRHYQGIKEDQLWMFEDCYANSFFPFWKKCKKMLDF